MNVDHIIIWNVHGLNNDARCGLVRESAVLQEYMFPFSLCKRQRWLTFIGQAGGVAGAAPWPMGVVDSSRVPGGKARSLLGLNLNCSIYVLVESLRA